MVGQRSDKATHAECLKYWTQIHQTDRKARQEPGVAQGGKNLDVLNIKQIQHSGFKCVE